MYFEQIENIHSCGIYLKKLVYFLFFFGKFNTYRVYLFFLTTHENDYLIFFFIRKKYTIIIRE